MALSATASDSNLIQEECVLFVELHTSPHLFILIYCFPFERSTILQQQFNRVGRVEHGSVALPGVIRSGSVGTESLSMGTMPSAQQQITTGQMHRGHMPPLVRRVTLIQISSADVSNCFMCLNT